MWPSTDGGHSYLKEILSASKINVVTRAIGPFLLPNFGCKTFGPKPYPVLDPMNISSNIIISQILKLTLLNLVYLFIFIKLHSKSKHYAFQEISH